MYDLRQAGAQTARIITPANDGMDEISFFDVKELYEIAYAEKTAHGEDSLKFSLLMKRAEMMDLAYRAQLSIHQAIRYENQSKAA